MPIRKDWDLRTEKLVRNEKLILLIDMDTAVCVCKAQAQAQAQAPVKVKVLVLALFDTEGHPYLTFEL